VGSESEIGGISHFFDEPSEDLPRRNAKMVTPEVIPIDIHEADEAALLAARNCKCANQ
jgi:hypothetical protein